MSGTLYIVSTPIGNLEDITLRALRVLREADLIAAEDTRVTRKLLSHFDIHTPFTSFHQHTRGAKTDALMERLERGESIALVSDAGTPLVSDPGAELIEAALKAGAQVIPIPGASAVLAALAASGLPVSRFAFDGFPPRAKTDRREFFESVALERRAVVLYESPARLLSTLEDLYRAAGPLLISVARELTKRFEEVYRGDLPGAIAHFREKTPRGEFTLVIRPGSVAGDSEAGQPLQENDCLRGAIIAEMDTGASPRDAVAAVAARLRLPRRTVYGEMLALSREREADQARRAR